MKRALTSAADATACSFVSRCRICLCAGLVDRSCRVFYRWIEKIEKLAEFVWRLDSQTGVTCGHQPVGEFERELGLAGVARPGAPGVMELRRLPRTPEVRRYPFDVDVLRQFDAHRDYRSLHVVFVACGDRRFKCRMAIERPNGLWEVARKFVEV